MSRSASVINSFLPLIFILSVGSAVQATPTTTSLQAPASASHGSKPAGSTDIMQDFDKLGGNEILLEKAKALQPDKEISIVQDRIVRRNLRFEISPELGGVVGGDPYVKTSSYGVNLHFHFNPYISVGVKYNNMGNQLSDQAQDLINYGLVDTGKAYVPDITFVKDQTLGLINIYPFYGKLKVFNRIAHFDIYGILGYGKYNFQTMNRAFAGEKSTWTAGAGVGFWLTNHLTARWELRHQSLRPDRTDGEVDMKWVASSVQMGYLF